MWVRGARVFVSSSHISNSTLYLTQQTFCFFSIENAQRLAPPMSLEDFFAYKSNYEMGKEFASWHCPALSVLRVSDLRLLKNLLLFFSDVCLLPLACQGKKPGFISVGSAECWPRLLGSASACPGPSQLHHLDDSKVQLIENEQSKWFGWSGAASLRLQGMCTFPEDLGEMQIPGL